MKTETKTHSTNSVQACQNCKNSFTIEPEDFEFYKKMDVPPPTWCPECRMVRRFSFWNEHNFFLAKHAKTGENLFSAYPESSGVKLYDHDFWWSDGFDPMQYGREYDFTRPFFEQFQALLLDVPRPSRSIWHLEQSDYCNNASRLKNCYLCFDCDQSEDCMYGVGFRYSKNSIDFCQSNYLDTCYELFSCDRCWRTFFSYESDDCRDVWFSYECYDCSHCFGCVNLRHKQYHIFNVPYTRDQYFKKLNAMNLGSYRSLDALREQTRQFWYQFPVRQMHGTHNENVIGEYVYHAKNAKYCYQSDKGVEDLKYCQRVVNNVAHAYDYTHWGDNSELMYEALICGENCRNVKFALECWPACEDIEYSAYCHSSTNLFGCVGLKKKSYCIFNRQYTKEFFTKLRMKIIEHMNRMPYMDRKSRVYSYGEFFPPELSPFAYNETIAQDFFPLAKETAIDRSFTWREPHVQEYKITVVAENLPDHIRDVTGSILKEIIECMGCKRAYRILPTELAFYQHMGLPLPRSCESCRYRRRLLTFRNPIRWYQRRCMCGGEKSMPSNLHNIYTNTAAHIHGFDHCPNKFETSYAPERPEIVYCETCYQSEVA